ncbi:NAD(P)/FAD-dependent oxidoreductase [Nesterenkonia aerolata]|uniref:FAD-binding oxidoreductase n=1 Tax=Nesterenkonia aerolata TaxID=3074079 RepID=A0ABU2DQE9_9MICC|nr:FAD-binding oxidoreductase [Nesterenkonia sp. LY-0111]MDR8018733.1 FAD-binding oxidoreductase [Nesterenkonia sp. LY-0111]
MVESKGVRVMRIGVIGAGVLGLTAAWEASQRGHEVAVLDKDSPFAGASHRSFAWINANNKLPASYQKLNALGVAEHRRFERELPSEAQWLNLCGNILVDFSSDGARTVEARLNDAEKYDYSVEQVNRARLAVMEPAVDWPDSVATGLFYPDEGYVDTDILNEQLVTALRRAGVPIMRREVLEFASTGTGATIRTDDGWETFDRVLLAAGADSMRLAQDSDYTVPMADLTRPSARTHSFLGLSEPTDLGLRHIVVSDRINVRPRHDGRMWVQVPHVENRAEEGASPEVIAEVTDTMEQELAELFGRPVSVDEVILSGRSFPKDGLSIIGHLDDEQHVYCTVTHSGMTLGPLFGRLAVDEIEGGSHDALLADFRPSRFAAGVSVAGDEYFIGKQ